MNSANLANLLHIHRLYRKLLHLPIDFIDKIVCTNVQKILDKQNYIEYIAHMG